MANNTEKNVPKISNMFNLFSDMASYEEIENTIASGAKMQGTNAWILMMAILVASIGLNTNSTAVIIGAMLISPLMSGIIAIAYGIATNNLILARFSAIRLTLQVIISVFTSFVYFSISPIKDASSELLARTSPTVWDVLIATCGGVAGIIGQTRKEKGNVIPGVAIATAIMPPLCTAGYGIAIKNWSYFSGAMYLFFINGFFICLSAIIVLKYLRVPQFRRLTQKQLGKIHRTIAVIAIITTMPSIYFAYDMIRDTIENSNAESFIRNEFVFEGTQVVQKTINIDDNVIEVSLIGKEITTDKQIELEDKLANYNLDGYILTLTQTKVKDGITADEVKELLQEYESSEDGPNVDEILIIKENEELFAENEQLRTENDQLRQQIKDDEAAKIDIKQLSVELAAINSKITGAAAADTELYISESDNGSRVIVTLFVSKSLSKTELDSVTAWLEARLSRQGITVLQQDIVEYRGEDSSTAEKDDKSKDDKSKTDKNKADDSSSSAE